MQPGLFLQSFGSNGPCNLMLFFPQHQIRRYFSPLNSEAGIKGLFLPTEEKKQIFQSYFANEYITKPLMGQITRREMCGITSLNKSFHIQCCYFKDYKVRKRQTHAVDLKSLVQAAGWLMQEISQSAGSLVTSAVIMNSNTLTALNMPLQAVFHTYKHCNISIISRRCCGWAESAAPT